MEEGGDEEMEMPVRRRRRVNSDQKRNGASASAEMEELRRGLGMDDENGEDNTLSQGEATGENAECEVCSDGEERGFSVEIEGEEGRAAVGIRAPQKVTNAEREEHERTPTPYRAWCPYCVKGRGRNTPHRLNKGDDDEELKVPRVSMDYFFMSQKDEKNQH